MWTWLYSHISLEVLADTSLIALNKVNNYIIMQVESQKKKTNTEEKNSGNLFKHKVLVYRSNLQAKAWAISNYA